MAEGLSFQDREAVRFARSLRDRCRQCPACGAITCIGDGHAQWHDGVQKYVDDSAEAFQSLVNAATEAITKLREDATSAIATANARTDQVRSDAAAAIAQLRTDATNAISGLNSRVTTLEGTAR